MPARHSLPSRAKCNAAPPKRAAKKARPFKSKNRPYCRAGNALLPRGQRLPPAPTGRDEIAIHPRDNIERDLLRTRRFALADIRAAPKALGVVLPHHGECSLGSLRLALRKQAQMCNLRARE